MDCLKERNEKRETHRNTGAKKQAINNYLSIITLKVKGLNAPIKRHRIAEWIRKHDPKRYCLQETHLRTEDLHRLKVKGGNKFSRQMDREKEQW